MRPGQPSLPSAIAQALPLILGGMLYAFSASANAIAVAPQPGPPWDIKSSVSTIVTNNGNGTWTYAFTVHNDSESALEGTQQTPVIVDWEVPYFADAGITNILSPDGWDYAIETIGTPNPATGWDGIAAWQTPGDPYYQGPTSPFTTVTQVLHWYLSAVWCVEGDGGLECERNLGNAIWPIGSTDVLNLLSLGDFDFTANYSPTDGPYQASWDFLPVQSGDPPLPLNGILPASPQTLGTQSIPLPGTLALLGVGLLGVGLTRRGKH